MKKTLIWFFLLAFITSNYSSVPAQQIPLLSDLFSRYEEFNRLYSEKRRAGANLSAVEPLRKQGEEAFKHGDIGTLVETISAAQALLTGMKWDKRQAFIASLTLEVDRLVIEPNQELQVSLTRMFPVNSDRTFTSTPTVTFKITSSTEASKAGTAKAKPQPLTIAERITVAETSSNAARRLLLPDGAYEVVAIVEAEGQKLAEIKRPIYSIGNFSDSVAQMSKAIAAIKSSPDPKVKAILPLVATPEFQLSRLAQLNKSRGEVDLNPVDEIDRIESELSALAKGENPFANARGEIERAYQAADGKVVPYRVYLPKSYDGASAKPLVVMLHGVLGDERYYFSGLFDPAVIKGEAERRGYILLGLNGRGRFANYSREGQVDVFEALNAVTRDYKIDASRIYLTGHSSGAFGAWIVASSKPEKFAAVAAVSGGPPAQGEVLTSLLAKLKTMPAMIAHGAQDGIAPVQLSRAMKAAAEKAGMKITYLEVPDGDHMSVVASTFSAVMDFFDKSSKPPDTK